MEIKKLKVKIIASLIIFTLLFSNFSICGLGIQQVIAAETENVVSIESSNINFSTLENSKTTLTITLNDVNENGKLFDNPTLKIKLPNGLENATISNPQILNGNGLQIEKTTTNKNEITIKLSGKQTSYDTTNLSGGVKVVIEIENIDYTDTLPTSEEKIELTCTQKTEVINAECNVNIISKSGLLILSKINGINENTITTIDSQSGNIMLDTNNAKKEVSQNITLVNNNEYNLENVIILGNIDSTFNMNFVKAVQAEGTIFYSTNSNAQKDDETWQLEYTQEAKAYKIVLNNTIYSKDTFNINAYTTIQEGLGYNQNAYLKNTVIYTKDGQEFTESLKLNIYTPKNEFEINKTTSSQIFTLNNKEIPVQVSITPLITEKYVHGNQIVKYKIEVKNDSEQKIKNINVTDIIPENAIYVSKPIIEDEIIEYIEDPSKTEETFTIEELNAGETKEFTLELKVKEIEQNGVLNNQVKVNYNEQEKIYSSEIELKVNIITAYLSTYAEDLGMDVYYNTNGTVEYRLKINNIKDEEIKNVKVSYKTPEWLEYVKGGETDFDPFDGYSIKNEGTYANNNFEYTIEKLKANSEQVIVIRYKVKTLLDGYTKQGTTIANVIINEDIYQTNLEYTKVEQAGCKVELTSNIANEADVKIGDKIQYLIKVTNIGKRMEHFYIKDSIPELIIVNNVQYSLNNKDWNKIGILEGVVELDYTLDANDVIYLKIEGNISETSENAEISNKAEVELNVNTITSNTIYFTVKVDNKEIKEQEEGNQGTEKQETYTISGVAWLDENKNGKMEVEEKMQNSVVVSLINKDTANFAKDSNGNIITTSTNSEGRYTFTNLPKGNYIVLFEFDTNTYTVTTYKKENVSEDKTSKVLLSKVTIDGNKKTAAITDSLALQYDLNNVNIGFVKNEKFDLSLTKQVSQIIVKNQKGTETYNYENGSTAKVDLVAKYMNGAELTIKYKFVVTNNGDITGYTDTLKDSLPNGLEFNQELNSNWYKGTDGNLYTNILSNEAIKSGESKEIELILTKSMTEDNTGIFVNNAELLETSNLEGKEEIDIENNKSKATLIVSIKTGTIIMYTGLVIAFISIIGFGVFEIKRRVLNKEK